MLIQFSVKNFRSIKEELTLQLIKGSGSELDGNNEFPANAKGAPKMHLLNSAVIYGANASGKSNIIFALQEMKWMVVNSSNKLEPEDEIDVTPFRFSSESISQPTEFNMDFVVEGVRYQYGYAATKDKVIEEWLFAFPNGKAQTWFLREYNESTGEYDWTKDGYLTGTKSNWKNATRKNSLFLSTAVQFNSKQLQPIFSWFSNTLRNVGFDGVSPIHTANKVFSAQGTKNEEMVKQDVLNFLKSADLGISDIFVKEDEVRLSNLPSSMPNSLKNEIVDSMKGKKRLIVKTGHKIKGSKKLAYLDLNEESDGTQRVFSLIAPWLDCLETGSVLFIDELHNSLHPNLVRFLISLFNSSEKNPNHAQLIFSTHETSVLNQQVFRRDQIWFCHKCENQETTISSLNDFKIRKNSTNLERDYLSGLYGAVPFVECKNINTTKLKKNDIANDEVGQNNG
jgi:AAA15 family ATPase/GTPase